uniref:Chemokine receptor vGPCR3B n=1 Tax=Simian cytomegalovirus (strain Colburn) TaxID=50292 RepID=D2E315_SCMVC|nr:chemokine receptor vGPCR3B [Cercopithecine betaherpesvirus 5]
MSNQTCNINDSLIAYGLTPGVTIGVYSLAGIVGLAGNLLILCVMYLGRPKWFAHDIFFMNMMFTDLAMILTIPAWVYYLINYSQLEHWECIGLSFAFYVPLFVHSDLIVAIAIERYQSLVRNKPVSVRAATVSCVFMWIVVILVSSPYYMFRGKHENQSCILGNYTWHIPGPFRTVMNVTINTWTFVVPAAAAMFLSLRIHSSSWGSRKMNIRTSFHIDTMAVTMLFFNGLFNLNIFRDVVADDSQQKSCDYMKQQHFFRMMGIASVFLRPVFSPIIYICVSRKIIQGICKLFIKVPNHTIRSERVKLMSPNRMNDDAPELPPREYESAF